MGKELTLILGGVRSGKSAFAVSLAKKMGDRVVFVATAEAGDEEMRRRIEQHRRARPPGWRTLEAPAGVGEALQAEMRRAEVVIVDCLTLLVANVMAEERDSGPRAAARVAGEVGSLLERFADGTASMIVVSNEVGMGVVPAYASGRQYRDLLGTANQLIARVADRVYWMVGGLPVEVKASGMAES